MSILHRIGWQAAQKIQASLSPHHARRLAELFADRARPEREQQSYECPICGYSGPFKMVFGAESIRFDAGCPKCDSRERHRYLKIWMDDDDCADSLGEVLHFAPEPELKPELVARSTHYRTADITPGRADLVLNIEAIDLPDSSVDTIVANHVLEHVDDAKALAEMFRVLRPGGLAILTMPSVPSWPTSYEDPSIVDSAQRYRHFGQEDHVRYFGSDIADRIRGAGFNLDIVLADGERSARYSLLRGDIIFLAEKPTPGQV